MDVPAIKNMVARILGITEKRPFPKFEKSRSRFARRAVTEQRDNHNRKKIIFLTDVFSHYIEPELEQAAFEILARCGYDIHVLPVIGAGASFLSKGFVDQARHHAENVLKALHRIDPANEFPIVGIEPPEVYCLKHDYVDLLPDREAEINRRLDNIWLMDEFLLRSEEYKVPRVVTLAEASKDKGNLPERKIKFHPHCHQRAEGFSVDGMPTGTNATLELLRLCGFEVELMDTGCCGMAGTFGYEEEHYDVSMKVAELKLFPQLRNLENVSYATNNGISEIKNQKSLIVSSGAACRMQIEQGTGLKAIHPLQLIAQVLIEVPNYDKK
jgi:Fe-S oxidoreductase